MGERKGEIERERERKGETEEGGERKGEREREKERKGETKKGRERKGESEEYGTEEINPLVLVHNMKKAKRSPLQNFLSNHTTDELVNTPFYKKVYKSL